MDKDVVLIQLDFGDPQSAFFPIASMLLSEYLHKEGISTECFDFNFQRHKRKKLSNLNKYIPCATTKIYGITLYFGMLYKALKVAKYLKEREPNCIIVLGGPGTFKIEKNILEKFNRFFDMIADQNAVLHFVEFCLNKKTNKKKFNLISGFFYWDIKQDKEIYLKSFKDLGHPDFWPHIDFNKHIDLYSYLKYQKIKELPIIVGSGCPYNCSFCSTCNFWKREFFVKSPKKLAEEINYLQKKYDIFNFQFIHDNFFPKKSMIHHYLREFNINPLTKWSIAIRFDVLDNDTIALLDEKGCQGITIGIESISERAQKLIKKDINFTEIYNIIDVIDKKGIEIHLSLILNIPGSFIKDDFSNIILSFNLASMYSKLDIKINSIMFLNGSELYNLRKGHIAKIGKEAIDILNFYLQNFPKTILCLLNSKVFFNKFILWLLKRKDCDVITNLDYYISNNNFQNFYFLFNYEKSLYIIKNKVKNRAIHLINIPINPNPQKKDSISKAILKSHIIIKDSENNLYKKEIPLLLTKYIKILFPLIKGILYLMAIKKEFKCLLQHVNYLFHLFFQSSQKNTAFFGKERKQIT